MLCALRRLIYRHSPPNISCSFRQERCDKVAACLVSFCLLFLVVVLLLHTRTALRPTSLYSPNTFSYRGSYFKYRGEGSQIGGGRLMCGWVRVRRSFAGWMPWLAKVCFHFFSFVPDDCFAGCLGRIILPKVCFHFFSFVSQMIALLDALAGSFCQRFAFISFHLSPR